MFMFHLKNLACKGLIHVNPSGAEIKMFYNNLVNIMAASCLALYHKWANPNQDSAQPMEYSFKIKCSQLTIN